ncbi:hypothetical protein Tco_0101889, partial [Tanacetum coccineum]
MFRRCVMRRLTTASSREYKTYLNHTPPQPYRSHMISPPLTPFNQLLVFRSLSTPPNHEDAKGSEPSSDSSSSAETILQSFDELMKKSIYDHPLIGGFITILATL